MFGDGSLAFQEFAMGESLPLARIQDAVFEFLTGRGDAVMFGAQAVNAYVGESRMSEDVAILSPRARELAEELRSFLADRFHIAVRLREIGEGKGFRIYQVQKPENRHLVDVRSVAELPPARNVRDILVLAPEDLVAQKVRAFFARRSSPKSGTDWRDIAALLLTFPELKVEFGAVHDRLRASGASEAVISAWKEIAGQAIAEQSEADEFE